MFQPLECQTRSVSASRPVINSEGNEPTCREDGTRCYNRDSVQSAGNRLKKAVGLILNIQESEVTALFMIVAQGNGNRV